MNKLKQQKKAASSEYFLSEVDFEEFFNHFLLYDYGPNSSEAVEKITVD